MTQVLYLIRHCQATGQAPDAPLTATGHQQAIALADWSKARPLERLVSSPYLRAIQSISPVAEQFGLPIETDSRLIERILSTGFLENWQESLAATFIDLDRCFAGGESSQIAMNRGVAVIKEVMQSTQNSVAIVTHGNLLTLMLRHFDPQTGFAEWQNLRNPDLYCVSFDAESFWIEHIENRYFNSV